MSKLKWGILSTAKIGREYVIPALLKSESSEVVAICSRNLDQSQSLADQFDIPKAYGSYKELLQDDNVDCIYNPLPNHLHAEWTIKAIKQGKHVLCEKPMAITQEEVEAILAARDEHKVAVGEAFMVRSSPQWVHVKKLIDEGFIGDLRTIQGYFSFFNTDPENIRNKYINGGGAMWDIGCYPITISRFITHREPRRVMGIIDYDPTFGIDRSASAILDFSSCQASFTVSTQSQSYQRIMIHGTKKTLEVKIPFNAPNDCPMIIAVHSGSLKDEESELISIPTSDQYHHMVDAFSKAALEGHEVPVPVEHALLNVKTILAVVESAKENRWVDLS